MFVIPKNKRRRQRPRRQQFSKWRKYPSNRFITQITRIDFPIKTKALKSYSSETLALTGSQEIV